MNTEFTVSDALRADVVLKTQIQKDTVQMTNNMFVVYAKNLGVDKYVAVNTSKNFMQTKVRSFLSLTKKLSVLPNTNASTLSSVDSARKGFMLVNECSNKLVDVFNKMDNDSKFAHLYWGMQMPERGVVNEKINLYKHTKLNNTFVMFNTGKYSTGYINVFTDSVQSAVNAAQDVEYTLQSLLKYDRIKYTYKLSKALSLSNDELMRLYRTDNRVRYDMLEAAKRYANDDKLLSTAIASAVKSLVQLVDFSKLSIDNVELSDANMAVPAEVLLDLMLEQKYRK